MLDRISQREVNDMTYAICNLCHQKNNTYLENRLRTILRYLKEHVEPSSDIRITFPWYINIKCKYGISCPVLMTNETACRRLSREIDPYLNGIIANGDRRTEQEVLSLLRGDFSSVYSVFEREFERKQKQEQD